MSQQPGPCRASNLSQGERTKAYQERTSKCKMCCRKKKCDTSSKKRDIPESPGKQQRLYCRDQMSLEHQLVGRILMDAECTNQGKRESLLLLTSSPPAFLIQYCYSGEVNHKGSLQGYLKIIAILIRGTWGAMIVMVPYREKEILQ